jgi:hypothetical protein
MSFAWAGLWVFSWTWQEATLIAELSILLAVLDLNGHWNAAVVWNSSAATSFWGSSWTTVSRGVICVVEGGQIFSVLDYRRFDGSSVAMSLWVDGIACLVLRLLLLLKVLLLLLVLLLLCLLILCWGFLLDIHVVFRACSLLFGVGYNEMRSRVMICCWVDLTAVQITDESIGRWISSMPTLIAGVWPWCHIWVMCAMSVLISVAILAWRDNHILHIIVDW